MIKKFFARKLLTLVSRWENKLWKYLYSRPRKYCSCVVAISNNKKSNCVIRDDNHDWGGK